ITCKHRNAGLSAFLSSRAVTLTARECGPRSAICQCPSVPAVSAHQCQCPINATYQCIPVHINAEYQCPSELPFSVTHQCQSVPPINASQCRLSMPVSAA
ncbi:unnamed protein product, partial [Staurois parvus]